MVHPTEHNYAVSMGSLDTALTNHQYGILLALSPSSPAAPPGCSWGTRAGGTSPSCNHHTCRSGSHTAVSYSTQPWWSSSPCCASRSASSPPQPWEWYTNTKQKFHDEQQLMENEKSANWSLKWKITRKGDEGCIVCRWDRWCKSAYKSMRVSPSLLLHLGSSLLHSPPTSWLPPTSAWWTC